MKQLLLICCVIAWAAGAFAQEYSTHWIAHPAPDSTSHIWFRQCYLQSGRPRQGYITIASTGVYNLYVNEYHVGTAVFYPAREPHSADVVVTKFDVTPYLRNDTNVVAIIFSPLYPHIEAKQISAVYHGLDSHGQPFAHHSDANWLCRQANSALNHSGGEDIDGRFHNTEWRSTNIAQALWLNARPVHMAPALTLHHAPAWEMRINRRRGYKYFDKTDKGVEYDFGMGCYGFVRLTLRDARRGQRIRFGSNTYICSGLPDEQACPVFSTSYYRRMHVGGGERFQREHVFDIEAIGIAPEECLTADAIW